MCCLQFDRRMCIIIFKNIHGEKNREARRFAEKNETGDVNKIFRTNLKNSYATQTPNLKVKRNNRNEQYLKVVSIKQSINSEQLLSCCFF